MDKLHALIFLRTILFVLHKHMLWFTVDHAQPGRDRRHSGFSNHASASAVAFQKSLHIVFVKRSTSAYRCEPFHDSVMAQDWPLIQKLCYSDAVVVRTKDGKSAIWTKFGDIVDGKGNVVIGFVACKQSKKV